MDQTAAIAALAALAQENRIDAFRLLVVAGPAGMPAGAIAEKLGIPAPTLSFHLAQLKHAGLVTCRRESRSLIYAANYPTMNGLIGYRDRGKIHAHVLQQLLDLAGKRKLRIETCPAQIRSHELNQWYGS